MTQTAYGFSDQRAYIYSINQLQATMENELETLLGLGIGFGILFFVFFALFMLPTIFYLLTLHRTFDEISEENRLMPSAQVWLTLIPLFGTIWQFIIIGKMADSLQKEFAMRGLECKEVRPGFNVGLAYCILSVTAFIPILGWIGSFAGLVCWIVYWVNINDYKNQLIRNPRDKVIS